MKRLFICLVCSIMILGITGCNDEPYEKNIYHSEWKSSSGYKVIINDPEKNSKITKPACWVEIGNETLGSCSVQFNKENGTIYITWAYAAKQKMGSATISKDTSSFTLDDIQFKWNGNI